MDVFFAWFCTNADDFLRILFQSLTSGVNILYIVGFYIVESSLNGAINLLMANPYEAEFGTIYSTIVDTFGYAVTIAANVVLVLVWTLDFLRQSSDYDHKETISAMFFRLLRFVVPAALINYYQWIVSIFITLANNSISSLSPTITHLDVSLGIQYNLNDNIDLMAEAANSAGLIGLPSSALTPPVFSLVDSLIVLIIFILCIVTAIKVLVAAITRTFKIFSIVILAPLALAFYGSKNTENMAIKYLTYLAKFMLEAIVLIAIIYIFVLYRREMPNLIIDVFPSMSWFPNLNMYFKAILDLTILGAMVSGAEQLLDRVF